MSRHRGKVELQGDSPPARVKDADKLPAIPDRDAGPGFATRALIDDAHGSAPRSAQSLLGIRPLEYAVDLPSQVGTLDAATEVFDACQASLLSSLSAGRVRPPTFAAPGQPGRQVQQTTSVRSRLLRGSSER